MVRCRMSVVAAGTAVDLNGAGQNNEARNMNVKKRKGQKRMEKVGEAQQELGKEASRTLHLHSSLHQLH
jgi:hypothetical protein